MKTIKINFFWLIVFAACVPDKQKAFRADLSLTSEGGGYNYAIVHVNKEERKIAQFSSVFYSSCDDKVIMERAKKYAEKNNFSDYKIGMSKPATTEKEAEENKAKDKREFQNSGFNIGGDNNYIGDCSK